MADTPSHSSFSFGRVLFIVVPLGLLAWAVSRYSGNAERLAQEDLEYTMVSRLLGDQARSPKLEARYRDADGDLVADPPQDESKLLDPEPINFSYVATSDADNERETWKDFVAALQEQLGREVKLVSYPDASEQLRALKKGDLHVTAFSTGETPSAVNEAGFVPVASFADDQGVYSYTMKIIVPADSEIEDVEDLRGQRMTFVRPRSNSGLIAPLVLLMKEHGLAPERDYSWGFSFGHENSIRGIAEGRFDAAAVASDILKRMVGSGEVDEEDIRVIYESEPYPPAVVGYAYNLQPELRDGIREALVNFQWEGTGLEQQYGKVGSAKFAPVEYKDDWAPVREINDASRTLFARQKPAA